MALLFEWDGGKADRNLAKHGVAFEDAVRVFLDPFALTEHDRVEGGERRWQTLGLVRGALVLLVAHTLEDTDDGDEVVRVVSARQANRSEKRRYDQARHRQVGD